MPDFLVSAATGALSPVLQKLAALLTDEYKRFKGVRGEIKFLIQELKAMHAFLEKKSEDENPDVQDKAWMMEVRELSYDIEDSLDEFMVRVDDESTKPDGFIDKCKNLLAKTKTRRRIAKAIQDLKAQVREASERNARYKTIGETVMKTSNENVDPRALAIFEDASRLVGIDKPKQELVSFLIKDDGGVSSQQPKILSIVGIGGIGKTTLAKQVYEELNNKHQFQCRVFLSVSRNPDMFKIFRTILSQVTGQPYYKTEAGIIQQLIEDIKQFLQTRRYLVVVDDVWDVKTWGTIKCALSNNSCGSVIITTTRIHDVAKACCSSYADGCVYEPNPLEEHASKRLFQNRIFGPGNGYPEDLKEVSDKILKKCGGLPLAIIAISGLLASKARNGVHTVTEWDQIQTSIGHGLERDATVEGMMGVLSLSYFDLPYHLKACLLYLSIFPEDYKIGKERLIRLWVAEGFIPAEPTCTLHESGEKSFNELINRNLILPWGISDWTGKVYSCCVHDTILDFIVCKSMEDNFVTVDDGRLLKLTPSPTGIKVRRLSMQDNTEGDKGAMDSNQNYANVRSIVSFNGVPYYSLLGFRFLRVLDFTGCKSLKNHHLANIGQLFQLRYLSLRRTWITELPEQIGELQYLQTLDLLHSKIPKIPTAILRLKGLANLQMGPVQLSCLLGGIGELNKMRDLRIDFLEDSDIDEASCLEFIKKMVSSVQQLNKLQILTLRCDKDIIFDGYDNMVEVPLCSASVRNLIFTMSLTPRVPNWIKSLVNIEELRLRIKKLDQESLYVLGSLPVLIFVQLQMETNVEDILSADEQRLMVSCSCGYRSLRGFIILSLPTSTSMPILTFEAGSMPKLEYLRICFHADETVSLTNGRLDFGFKHLSQLTKLRCDIFGSKLNIWRVETALRKERDNHPNLPDFQKHGYPSVEGERSNRQRLRPRRSSTAQPKPPCEQEVDSSEQEVVQDLEDDVVIWSSEVISR